MVKTNEEKGQLLKGKFIVYATLACSSSCCGLFVENVSRVTAGKQIKVLSLVNFQGAAALHKDQDC